MKTTQYTFAKLGLASLALILLSFVWNQNDNTPQSSIKVDPISFANLTITLDDTSFTVGNHTVKAYRAFSGGPEPGKSDGITLAYGQFPKASMVEISLFDTVEYNTITLGIFNNSDPVIELLYQGEVVKKYSGEIESGLTNVAIDVEGKKVDAIRVASFEATLMWMRLE
ncbi:MAG: hypothetical protein GQ574_07465 [Crocinitomix sp.]|nr:hypothetical protein [Crocinitomix sp.]